MRIHSSFSSAVANLKIIDFKDYNIIFQNIASVHRPSLFLMFILAMDFPDMKT